MVQVGPAERELLETIFRQPLNRLPHNQVIGPQLLKPFVRSPVFVNRLATKSEKDRTGHLFALVLGQGHKTFALADNFPADLFKKNAG